MVPSMRLHDAYEDFVPTNGKRGMHKQPQAYNGRRRKPPPIPFPLNCNMSDNPFFDGDWQERMRQAAMWGMPGAGAFFAHENAAGNALFDASSAMAPAYQFRPTNGYGGSPAGSQMPVTSAQQVQQRAMLEGDIPPGRNPGDNDVPSGGGKGTSGGAWMNGANTEAPAMPNDHPSGPVSQTYQSTFQFPTHRAESLQGLGGSGTSAGASLSSELSDEVLVQLARKVVNFLDTRKEGLNIDVPSTTKRTKLTGLGQEVISAIREHVHLSVCGGLGGEYAGRNHGSMNLPDDPDVADDTVDALAEGADGAKRKIIPIFWLRDWRDSENKSAIHELTNTVIANWKSSPGLEDVDVVDYGTARDLVVTYLNTLRKKKQAAVDDAKAAKDRADMQAKRRSRRRRADAVRYTAGLAKLREELCKDLGPDASAQLVGADELADMGYFDSEATDDDMVPVPKRSNRRLNMVKKEWIAPKVRTFTRYVLSKASDAPRALARNYSSSLTNHGPPKFLHIENDKPPTRPRMSYMNPRWMKKNTYKLALPDDPEHTFLDFVIPEGAFKEEEEAWLADDEGDEDGDGSQEE